MLRLSADGSGMVQGLEISGLPGMIALGLPIAALAFAMVFSLRRIGRRTSKPDPRGLAGRYGVSVPAPAPASAPEKTTVSPGAPPPAEPAATADEIARRIAKAEAAGSQAELPALYLGLARDRIASERGSEAIPLLTACLRVSAALGQKEAQAGARLELGDLARSSGDLTTACEHWQMARGIFHDLKKAAELAAAERRMRQHGCPTDWVLNDF